MFARWSVLLGVVAGLATAAVGTSGLATARGTSVEPVATVAGGARGRRHIPPRYRYMFSSESAPVVVAAHGCNLLDISMLSSAPQLPRRTRGVMWVGNYDNSTCDWELSDAALTAEIAPKAGDAKVAGYNISDEPDPNACPSAPAQHRARS